MNTSKPSPVVIGTFVLGALVLAAVAIITLGGAAFFSPKQRAVIFFEGNVNGLAVGSAVTFRGVRVGQVDRVVLQLDTATLDARIPVFITLLPAQMKMIGGAEDVRDIPFAVLIKKGFRAKLAMQSIVTGELAVDLDFRPDTEAVLVGSPDPDIPEIPAIKSDFDVLKDQLSQVPFRQLAEDVKSLVASISLLAGGGDQALGTLNIEMQATAASARQTLDAATVTLRSLQQTSDQAAATLTRVSPALEKTLASAEAALKRAESTLTNADATLAQTAELTAPGSPLRADLEQSLRDLSASAESLRDFANTVERRPNALLFGKD